MKKPVKPKRRRKTITTVYKIKEEQFYSGEEKGYSKNPPKSLDGRRD